MTKYFVEPTSDRSGNRGRYLVIMSRRAIQHEFGRRVPSVIVVSYCHPKLENIEVSAIGWLRSRCEDDCQPSDKDETVQLDQTIRQALGLDYYTASKEKVSIARLHGAGRFREIIADVVGRRLVYCRPGVLQHRDIEKGITRTPEDVLGLLGIKSGESVILVGVEKRAPDYYRMRIGRSAALAASERYQDEYVSLRREDRRTRYSNRRPRVPDMTARTPCIEELLNQTDLSPVYLDQDIRDWLLGSGESQRFRYPPNCDHSNHQSKDQRLGWLYPRTVQCAQPLLLYRAPSGAIANEIMAIGVTAAALGINSFVVLRAFFDPKAWAVHSAPVTLALVVSSIAAAFLAALWKTRAAVRGFRPPRVPHQREPCRHGCARPSN